MKEFIVDENNRIPVNLRENTRLEASAGTGKTYSLERIVLNLITEYNLSVKEILVVTFTNKATREMKERIRQILIEELRICSDESRRARIENAVTDFDEAGIFTIHGFCQYILQTYPFESMSLFSQGICKDDRLLEVAVRDFLRDLEEVDARDLQEFAAFRGSSSFSETVSRLMDLFKKDEFRDELPVFPGEGEIAWLYTLQEEFESGRGDLFESLEYLKKVSAEVLYASSKAMKSRTTPGSFKKLEACLKNLSLDKGFLSVMEGLYDKDCLTNLMKLTTENLEKKGKPRVADMDVTTREVILSCDTVPACLDFLFNPEDLKNNPVSRVLKTIFIRRAVADIEKRLKTKQSLAGEMDFADLIENLHRALQKGEDVPLARMIKKQYKVALIDEFQDTDKKQWDIFYTLFGQGDGHNFFLIGDPKQSIYGFRGADLEIYFEACDLVQEENTYFLGTNYRSERGIVQGVNTLFEAVFDRGGGNGRAVPFMPVKDSGKTPREIDGKSQNIEFLYYDEPVDEKKSITGEACKRGYFRLVVNKIVFLLNECETVQPGHIAILVENHKDSALLRDDLLKRSVPVVVSRQRSVFNSPEALELCSFFKALASPGRLGDVKAALLTHVMGFHADDILNMEDEGELEEVSARFLLWSQKLVYGGLIALWKEVEAYSPRGHFQERTLSLLNGERIYTNTRQIIERLNSLQKRERLDCLALYDRLVFLMSRDSEEDENCMRLDRDSEAVQIMTMHASKGLEFPIVFFAGGFGTDTPRGTPPEWVKFVDKNKGKTGPVVDFMLRKESVLLAARDEWEEKKRLYYVACTRASSRLYMPLFENGALNRLSSLYGALAFDENRTRLEDLVPVTCFEQPLHRLLKIGKEVTKHKKMLSQKICEDVYDMVKKQPDIFSIDDQSYGYPPQGIYEGKDKKVPFLKFDPLKKGFRHRVISVTSYSALTREEHGSWAKEDADRKDEEETPVLPLKKSEVNSFNIPGGAVFGDLIHDLFEQVNFDSWKLSFAEFSGDSEIHELADSLGKKYFDSDWTKKHIDVVKQILWNTLRSPLDFEGEKVPLGSFDESKRIHEREFYFKIEEDNCFTAEQVALEVHEGYLKGFIDLILNHKGRLYIADWKTTTIKGAEDFSRYGEESVEEVMVSHHYHLQGWIYTAALYLHLNLVKEDFSYDEHMGGYFYLFVRGMGPEGGTGVSYFKPEENELKAFIKNITGREL